jgi:hypothetical protein
MSPLQLVFKIAYIRAVNCRLGIMHCFIIFSQLLSGPVCIVTISFDSVVACFNVAVQDVMEHEITRGVVNANSKFPHWHSSTLNIILGKRIVSTDVKNKSDSP